MRLEFDERIAQMSDEGLMDAWMNPSDYQGEFVELMHKELVRRGVDLTEATEERSRKLAAELEGCRTGRPGTDTYITLGFIFSALGGLLGLFAGFNYAFKKRTGPDRARYHEYNEVTRRQGILMIGIGFISILVTITLQTGC